MARTAGSGPGLASPAGPYSPSVRIGAIVACAGQTGRHDDGSADDDIRAQTRQALRNVEAALAASGASTDDVLHVRVYLVNKEDFAPMNEVYAEFFSEPYPARTTVYVGLPSPWMVEIDALAALG